MTTTSTSGPSVGAVPSPPPAMHKIPVNLLDTFLQLYLPQLETVVDSTATHHLLTEFIAKWQQMFAFAQEFKELVQHYAPEVGAVEVGISNDLKNKIQSLAGSGEIAHLKALLAVLAQVASKMKSES